jgi:multiple sugar transport system permease protein
MSRARTAPQIAAGRFLQRGIVGISTAVGLFFLLFPVYWMFTTSLATERDLVTSPPRLTPNLARSEVYQDVIDDTSILDWMSNSFVIALGTCLLTLPMAYVAAYALSRFKFKGKNLFEFALFTTQMLPEALLVVPFYGLFLTLGLLNSLYGLVFVHSAFILPVVVWLLKGAIDAVPKEIEESARMDGASSLSTMTVVVAPLVSPSLAAGAIIAFFYGWDEYLFANTFITSDEIRPASVGLASMVGEYLVPMNSIMAGSFIFTIPAVLFFVLMQKYVVGGLVAGSVKG